MKYLKLFQEKLRDETYKSAIDKLRSMGHERRSQDMKKELMRRSYGELEKYGPISIWIKNGKYMMNKDPIELFFSGIKLDTSSFDKYEDLSHPFSIVFYARTHKDEEISKILHNTNDFIGRNNQDLGIVLFKISPSVFSISDIEVSPRIQPISSEMITMGNFEIKFSDRRSTLKFKKVLNDILDGSLKIPVGKDEDVEKDITLKEGIRNFLLSPEFEEMNLNFTLSDVEELAKNLKNIRVNLLYSEDGNWK